MEIKSSIFDRVVLLIVLIFCAATYGRLLPLGVGKDEVAKLTAELNQAFATIDGRLKKLEPQSSK